MRVNVTPAGGEPSITNFLIEVDDDGDANVFDTVRYVNASGVIGDVEVCGRRMPHGEPKR